MLRRPPKSTLPATLFPYTRPCRSFRLRGHALADLRAQLAVGAFQLARPRLDAELELGVRGLEVLLRALARQCAVDVVGDEGEQLLVARSEADLRRVAL